jgi:hypothetical protein
MNEKQVRLYANHLALTVRRRGSGLTLSERYGVKKKIGEFCSIAAVKRALDRYIDRALAEMKRPKGRKPVAHGRP